MASLDKPVPGADVGTWGTKVNAALDALNAELTTTTATAEGAETPTGAQAKASAAQSAAIAASEPRIDRTGAGTGWIVTLKADGGLQFSQPGAGQTVPDATSNAKGVVQLIGDLGGTATAPTTPTAVHKTGAESIAGVKTFSDKPVVPDATFTLSKLVTTGTPTGRTALTGTGAWTSLDTVTATTVTGNYTVVAADAGTVLEVNSASAVTVTVPPNVLPVGAVLEVVQLGAGQVKIEAGSGATILSAAGQYLRTQYASAGLRARTASAFVLSGDLTATAGSGSGGGSTETYNLYMGPGGSDGNPGTQALPKGTLQGLYNALSAGQTGGVLPGDYSGSTANLTVGSGSGGSSASALKRIVGIKDSNGNRPVLRGTVNINGSYVELKSLAFDLETAAAALGTHSVWRVGGDNTVTGCVFDDLVLDGKGSIAQSMLGGGGSSGTSANNCTVRNCVFANIQGPDSGGPGHGVYLQRGSGWTISRNVFYRCGTSFGGSRAIQLYPYATNCLVEFNTIDDSVGGGVVVGNDNGDGVASGGHTIRYNIMTNLTGRPAISSVGGLTSGITTNNNHYDGNTATGFGNGSPNNSVQTEATATSGNPLYVNRLGVPRDYRLQAGSPAAGKGYTG